MWVRLIMIPYQFLYPAILVFCAIGVFSLKNATFDIYLMALFGIFGYVFSKLGCEPAPMLLAFILGPLMEEYLRRAMLLSRGNPMVFIHRPISATLLALAVLAMLPVFCRHSAKPAKKRSKNSRPLFPFTCPRCGGSKNRLGLSGIPSRGVGINSINHCTERLHANRS